MKSYLSVYSATTYEKVIERSRFIANCAHAESEEEAKAFIAKVRAEEAAEKAAEAKEAATANA